MNQMTSNVQVESLQEQQEAFVAALTSDELELIAGGAPTVNSL